MAVPPAGPGRPAVAVTMEHLEAVLAARAAALGVEIRRGRRSRPSQSADGVTVRAGGETVRGRWLVGCDGGRSTVRKAAGFDFAGTEPEFTGYSVDVELADPGRAPTRAATTRQGHVHLRPARDDRDGRVRRRRLPPDRADHARARAGGAAPRLRHGRRRDGPAARHDLDGPRLPGDRLPHGADPARGRRRAHPFAPGRPGAQPRARRRDEPRLEAGRHRPRRRAGRTCSTATRANATRSARRCSTGRAPRSR